MSGYSLCRVLSESGEGTKLVDGVYLSLVPPGFYTEKRETRPRRDGGLPRSEEVMSVGNFVILARCEVLRSHFGPEATDKERRAAERFDLHRDDTLLKK